MIILHQNILQAENIRPFVGITLINVSFETLNELSLLISPINVPVKFSGQDLQNLGKSLFIKKLVISPTPFHQI